MYKYVKKVISKYRLGIGLIKSPANKNFPEPVEFELPENAQFNPRIPEMIHGKLGS
jgi:hypothetical protein